MQHKSKNSRKPVSSFQQFIFNSSLPMKNRLLQRALSP